MGWYDGKGIYRSDGEGGYGTDGRWYGPNDRRPDAAGIMRSPGEAGYDYSGNLRNGEGYDKNGNWSKRPY